MQLVRDHLHGWNRALPRIAVLVERATLAKRRWRGIAADGAEFGFDLDHPLADGDVVFVSETAVYVVEQMSEPVLEIALIGDSAVAARLGWLIGNLHFQIQVERDLVRVADDPAIRQLLDREHIAWSPANAVFKPISGGHAH